MPMHWVRSSDVLQSVLSNSRKPAIDGEANYSFPQSQSLPSDSRVMRCSLPRVGFVPTMGALHAGHISLIERAVKDCHTTVVSIFVNPLQFGPTEDLAQYPRQLERDLELCRAAGVDIVFAPEPSEFLGGRALYQVTKVVPPAATLENLCAPWRPGHFEGVLTIVIKLLHLVQPDRAYFGQKDAQQLSLIRRMVRDFSIPIEVIGCPIVRDPDGLALSSRNQYLSDRERQVALALSKGLFAARDLFERGERNTSILLEAARRVYDGQLGLAVQYVSVVHPETLELLTEISQVGLMAAAATVGQTRLIDNVCLDIPRKPILAIDGPAGAGKSTVARQLSSVLDLLHLDTGALYRAVTWLALETNTDISNEVAVADLAATANIRFEPSSDVHRVARVWVGDREVTQKIRTPTVTAHVSAVSAHPLVREILLRLQQNMGRTGGGW